ncbi:MAG: Mor transcription activator family protein [Rhodocyclales bacterium]|nr:Mor transcription activator family protein [Rhodocyclales bacterium]
MLNPDDINEELLPAEIRAMCTVIGITAVMKLVEIYGGARLYIPASVSEDHPLAQLIGYDSALALAKEFGQDRPEITRCLEALRAVRNARICKEARHKSQPELARQYRLTQRMIRIILDGLEDDMQQELF